MMVSSHNAFRKGIMVLLIGILGMIAFTQFILEAQEEREYGVDLAFGRRVHASPHTDDNIKENAVDADDSTRYAAEGEDDAFFYVDLDEVEKIGKVVIDWEGAHADEYTIQLSNDAVNWTDAVTITNTDQTTDEIIFPEWMEAQYVRFQGVSRATEYGYSFYAFEVYGPRSVSQGQTVSEVSSHENETELPKEAMLDGEAHTRWASTTEDDQYVLFDMNSPVQFDMVKIRWEVSFARIFDIYAHPDTDTMPERDDPDWYKVTGSDTGLGEVDTLSLGSNEESRFIKLELVQRETSEATKKTGRFPWESTFSIYSFELFDWDAIESVPLGQAMEFSQNSPSWTAMNNMHLNDSGLLLAPQGYPIQADGEVTDLESIEDGDIPGFESYATYNPGIIYDDDREMFHMIYRAELPDNFEKYFMPPKYEMGHMSSLAYASSENGVDYERGDDNPVLWPTNDDENGGGIEDPRVFKIKDDPKFDGQTTYYITYTMYDNDTTRQGIAYTHDFETFHKVGRIAPDYDGALKSGSYLTDPEGNAVKINDPRPGKEGKVYMIYMKDGSYTRIGFTDDVTHVAAEDIVDIDTSGFGSNSIEALTKGNESCMALTHIYGEDDDNIYLLYGGTWLSDDSIQYQQPNVDGWFYALGALKTTQSNPFELTNVEMDLDEPSIHPTETNKIDYGLFEKCMFADSMIRQDGTWYLYYGAGDMYVGLATARGDFSAGAAIYERDADTLTASTYALNKFHDGRAPRSVQFVSEIRTLSGTLVEEVSEDYTIDHFTLLEDGSYDKGVFLDLTMDLSSIEDLPEMYYINTFVKDSDTGEVLNQVSTYTEIDATVEKTVK